MKEGTLEYAQAHKVIVVCAANRNQYGDIVLGARHFDMTMHSHICILAIATGHEVEDFIWEQGFIDQWGRFMTREEAMVWALKNGQVNRYDDRSPVHEKLYSENLY